MRSSTPCEAALQFVSHFEQLRSRKASESVSAQIASNRSASRHPTCGKHGKQCLVHCGAISSSGGADSSE